MPEIPATREVEFEASLGKVSKTKGLVCDSSAKPWVQSSAEKKSPQLIPPGSYNKFQTLYYALQDSP
jgi:hypothetical protein